MPWPSTSAKPGSRCAGRVEQVTRLGSLEPTVMTIDDLFRRIHDAAASGKYERSRRTTTATSAIRRGSSSGRSPRSWTGTRSSRSRHSGGSTDPERRARREPRDHRGRKTRGDAMTDRPRRLLEGLASTCPPYRRPLPPVSNFTGGRGGGLASPTTWAESPTPGGRRGGRARGPGARAAPGGRDDGADGARPDRRGLHHRAERRVPQPTGGIA